MSVPTVLQLTTLCLLTALDLACWSATPPTRPLSWIIAVAATVALGYAWAAFLWTQAA